ncbi:potassium voltage-gated channel protein Shaw-like isoform X1 [Lineus longissimus]|uniref:potassium voltage-gated channel protein Shaw-like isoform X1 n=1 Tax=Lineus longissimus TaxID=88925 RepID=UPI00315CB2D0
MNSTTLNGAPKMGALDIVRINVGGTIFMTSRKTLKTFPGTKLDQLGTNCGEYDEKSDSYFFDRNPVLFNYVLDCYRSGRFHFPSYLCGDSVMEELCFWGLDDNVIANCCLKSYDDYEERRHTLEAIYKTSNCDMRQKARTEMLDNTGLRRMRYQLWLFLEYPNSSTSAKIWSVVYIFLVFTSLMAYCLQTCPSLRIARPASNLTSILAAANLTVLPKMMRMKHTIPIKALVVVDLVVNCIITVDIALRFLLAPYRLRLLKTFYFVLDLVCLVTYWLYQILQIYWMKWGLAPQVYVALIIAVSFQPLRVFRFFKLSRSVTELNAIMLAIRHSASEFFVLVIFFISGVIFFSIVMYYVEFYESHQFQTIPATFWWAVITMTTVGYGDVYPTNTGGYILGGICAIAGIVITGLTISIISNNLSLHYGFARLQTKLDMNSLRTMNNCDKDSIVKHSNANLNISMKSMNTVEPIAVDNSSQMTNNTST